MPPSLPVTGVDEHPDEVEEALGLAGVAEDVAAEVEQADLDEGGVEKKNHYETCTARIPPAHFLTSSPSATSSKMLCPTIESPNLMEME